MSIIKFLQKMKFNNEAMLNFGVAAFNHCLHFSQEWLYKQSVQQGVLVRLRQHGQLRPCCRDCVKNFVQKYVDVRHIREDGGFHTDVSLVQLVLGQRATPLQDLANREIFVI
jgi:hypothetical protein